MSEFTDKSGRGATVTVIEEDEKAGTVTYWPGEALEPDARITMSKVEFEATFEPLDSVKG